MHIAVFSDTHGRARGMLDAVRQFKPDMVIHCGDGCRDVQVIEREFPGLPIYGVEGNCDIDSGLPLAGTIEINEVKIFVAHGHTYGVRYGNLDSIAYAAEEAGAKVALYGHTHKAQCDIVGSVTIINPGSAGMGSSPSWCMLSISPDSEIHCKFMDI